MMTKLISVILFFLISISVLNAQSIDNWIERNEKFPIQKLYLQTDREFYFTGERIWFKTYLTDSRSWQLIPGAENIYVNLINNEGVPVMKSVIMSVNGQAPGNMAIPENIKPGTYLLEGFTDYLLNFGPNTFFYKPVTISGITPSVRLNQNEERFSRTQQMVADVSFLPEGGNLLANVSNLVAFKAVNRDGYGVEAKGSVRDGNGNIVTEFQTDYKGMGLFFFIPEPGKSYTARINGFPSFQHDFENEVIDEGVKLQVVNHSSADVIVNIAGNSEKFTGETYYLINMHRGEVIFYQAFKYEKINHVLKFDSQNLKSGINRLVLLDSELSPVSERLIFSDNIEINQLQVNPDKESYNARSPVTVKIEDEKQLSPDEFSNLSVSVLHENAISRFGVSQTIMSYLLLNSELNGFVEQSADFFTDEELNSRAKLKLLMLTNGWSSYLWNSVPNVTDSIKYKPKVGIDIKGTAINSLNETPVSNGEITLIIGKDGETAFLTQNTNKEGKFTFPGLLFNDTAKAYIQARNKRGKLNTAITISPVLPEPAPALAQLNSLNSFITTPYKLRVQEYENKMALRRFDPGLRLQSPENEPEEKQAGDGHFRIYNKADQVIEIPPNEASYNNVLDFISGKAPGVDITSEGVRIRGTGGVSDNTDPLFLVDGVPVLAGSNIQINYQTEQEVSGPDNNSNGVNDVFAKVKSIPLNNIDKVEILKSPQNLALFGTEGSNGVIAIYTKRGAEANPNPFVKGLIEKSIQGYTSNKVFYSPKYTPENQNDPKPDVRTTLFWEPEITTQTGDVNLKFFTSDQTGRFKIIVEGITGKGKICLGTAGFEVVNDETNSFGQVSQ